MPPFDTITKRFSCDRCHIQKLRCSRRDPNIRDDCVRCLRQGAKCVYSAPLPKGRPSAQSRIAQKAVRSTTSGSSAPQVYLRADSDSTDASGDSTSEGWSSGPCVLPAAMNPQTPAEAAIGLGGMSIPLTSGPPSKRPIPHAHLPDGKGDIFEQLLQISTRLSPLSHLSCTFLTRQKEHGGPIITDAALDSVFAWLSSRKIVPACMAFHDTFQASQAMLIIFRRLTESFPAPRSPSGSRLDAVDSELELQTDWENSSWHLDDNPAFPCAGGDSIANCNTMQDESLEADFLASSIDLAISHSAAAAPPQDTIHQKDPHTLAARHMATACYILLLNIYSALIAALHHDIRLITEHSPQREGNDDSSCTSLSDVRITLLVQFISRMVARLRRAALPLPETGAENSLENRPCVTERTVEGSPTNRSIAELEAQNERDLAHMRAVLQI